MSPHAAPLPGKSRLAVLLDHFATTDDPRDVGRITGHVGVEDILDTLFSRFCIGK